MAVNTWTASDTKRLAITVIGGVIATVAATYVLDRMRQRRD